MAGPERRFGLEVEMIHLKMVADTSRPYEVTSEPGSALPASGASPMNLVVQEYRMTHGVNLALANVVVGSPSEAPADRSPSCSGPAAA